MRQRNDTDQDLMVHTDPPQLLPPGVEVDHDTPVVGLTVLDEPLAGDTADDAAPKKATKTSAKEATA